MSDQEKTSHVQLPDGVFTSEGIWYHTTEEDLTQFAPDLVERKGISALLAQAADWMRLPIGLAVLGLAALLVALTPWQAALGSVLIYLFLAVVSPTVVIYSLSGLTKKLNHPIVQGLLYVMILSYLASVGQFSAVGTGLVGFILFRWQIISRLLEPVVQFLSRPLSSLATPDTILRNVLIRGSLKYGYPIGEVERMEKRMTEIMTYHKSRSKRSGKRTN